MSFIPSVVAWTLVSLCFQISHIRSETLHKQMPRLLSLLILFRFPFFLPWISKKSFLFMKTEKNAYFLIKVCSVCFSITQHMSDQQLWWAHQTKKCLRLARAPPPEPWFVGEPPPLASGSLIWTLFQTLIYPEKAYRARFPRFSSASSLIFICFLVFTPGGRPPKHAADGRPSRRKLRRERTLPCSRELVCFSVFLFKRCSCTFSRFCQLVHGWKRRGCFLRVCPFSVFVCLTAARLPSRLTLLRQSGKLSCRR